MIVSGKHIGGQAMSNPKPVKALAPKRNRYPFPSLSSYYTARWKMSDGTVKSYTGSRCDPNNRMNKAEAMRRAQAMVEQAQ